MTQAFDAYHKWLGIPPAEQPPNHYRLLGLTLFESDPDVILSAAEQRIAHVRTFQISDHAEASQRILNELAAARVCLLKPEEKAAYDTELRRQFAQMRRAPAISVLPAVGAAPAPAPVARARLAPAIDVGLPKALASPLPGRAASGAAARSIQLLVRKPTGFMRRRLGWLVAAGVCAGLAVAIAALTVLPTRSGRTSVRTETATVVLNGSVHPHNESPTVTSEPSAIASQPATDRLEELPIAEERSAPEGGGSTVSTNAAKPSTMVDEFFADDSKPAAPNASSDDSADFFTDGEAPPAVATGRSAPNDSPIDDFFAPDNDSSAAVEDFFSDSKPAGGIQLVSEFALPDPYVFYDGADWYIFGTGPAPFFLQGNDFGEGKMRKVPLDLDMSGFAFPVAGIWGFVVQRESDGSHHAYATLHLGNFHTVIACFEPLDDKWEKGKPIARWRFARLLVGDPARQDWHYYESKILLDANQERYLMYCATIGGDNHILAQRMLSWDKLDPSASPRLMLKPEGYRSEDRNGPGSMQIVEGGSIFKWKGTYVLFYSLGDFEQSNYKLGVAFSDSLIPPQGMAYRKVKLPDPGNLWGNANHSDEIGYLLQSEHRQWPNYIGDVVSGPGLGSVVPIDGTLWLFFHGRMPSGSPQGRFVFRVPISLSITSGPPRLNWVHTNLSRDQGTSGDQAVDAFFAPDSNGQAAAGEDKTPPAKTSATRRLNKVPNPVRPRYAPDDAVLLDGNWYWFSSEKASFEEARRHATRLKGRLLTISSATENALIAARIKGPTFIGILKTNGVWLNSTGNRQQYFNWDRAHEQPSAVEGEIYAAIFRSGLWGDYLPDRLLYCIEWGDETPQADGTKRSEKNGEKGTLANSLVVGDWLHQPPNTGPPGRITLHQNGTINGGTAKWTFNPGTRTLELRWPGGNSTGVTWVDTVQVSQDGRSYEGTNQQGMPVTGKRLN